MDGENSTAAPPKLDAVFPAKGGILTCSLVISFCVVVFKMELFLIEMSTEHYYRLLLESVICTLLCSCLEAFALMTPFLDSLHEAYSDIKVSKLRKRIGDTC